MVEFFPAPKSLSDLQFGPKDLELPTTTPEMESQVAAFALKTEKALQSDVNTAITLDTSIRQLNRSTALRNAVLEDANPVAGLTRAAEIASQPIKAESLGSIYSRTQVGAHSQDIADKIDEQYFYEVEKGHFVANLPTPEQQAERDLLTSSMGQRFTDTELEKVLDSGNATMKDYLDFASMNPLNPQAEVDFDNMKRIFLEPESLASKSKRLEALHGQLIKRYGPEIYKQMGAFMVKEGIIDGLPLVLGGGWAKAAAKGAPLLMKVGALARRSALVGVGGGSTQALINTYIDRDPEVLTEIASRTVGFAGGELLIGGIAKAGRAIKGAFSRAAKDTGAVPVGDVNIVDPTIIDRSINKLSGLRAAEDKIRQGLIADVAQVSQQTGKTAELGRIQALIKDKFANGDSDTGVFTNHSSLEALREISPNASGETIDDTILRRGVGNRLFGETTSRQQGVKDLVDYHWDNGNREVTFRAGKYKGDTSLLGVRTAVSEPFSYIGDPAHQIFDMQGIAASLSDVTTQAWKRVSKGLEGKDLEPVMEARLKTQQILANDPTKSISDMDLIAMGLTPDQQDAYYAMERLANFNAKVADKLMVNSAIREGIKQIDVDGQTYLAKVLRNVGENTALVRTISKRGEAIEIEVPLAKMKDPERVLGFTGSYVPIRYQDAFYHVSVLDLDTKVFKRTHSLSSLADAKKVVRQIEQEGGRKVAVYGLWNQAGDQFSMGLGKKGLSVMDSLSEDELSVIREALAGSGVDPEELAQYTMAFDHMSYSSLGANRIGGARGATRLLDANGNPAPIKAPLEAYTDYINSLSGLVRQESRRWSTRKFQEDFSDVLDPKLPWSQKLPAPNGRITAERIAQARSVQSWLEDVWVQENSVGRAYNNLINNTLHRIEGNTPFGKAVVAGLNNAPLTKQLFNETRGLSLLVTPVARTLRSASAIESKAKATTSMVAFLGNVQAFIGQVAPSLAVNIGARLTSNPTALAEGLSQVVSAATAAAVGDIGKPIASKTGAAGLKALRRSGWISEVDIVDLADRLVNQGAGPYHYLMSFVRGGEAGNRALSFFIARAEKMQEAEKGILKGLDGATFKGTVDDDEFTRLVIDRAKVFALDLSPAGKLKALNFPLAGLMLQFFSAPFKQAKLLFTGATTKAEKVGVGLSLYALGGPTAIPFVSDMISLSDKAIQSLTDSGDIQHRHVMEDVLDSIKDHVLETVDTLPGMEEEDKKFLKTTLKKGALSALTDGDLTLANKLSMNALLTDLYSNYTSDPLKSIPFISISSRIAAESGNILEYFGNMMTAMEINDVAKGDPSIYEKLRREGRKEVAMAQFISDTTNAAGRVFPGFGSIMDLANNMPETRQWLHQDLPEGAEDKFLTRSGKLMGERPVTTGQFLARIAGFATQSTLDELNKQESEYKWKQALNEIGDEWVNRYQNASTYEAKGRVTEQMYAQGIVIEQQLITEWEGALTSVAGAKKGGRYRIGSLATGWLQRAQARDARKLGQRPSISRGAQ